MAQFNPPQAKFWSRGTWQADETPESEEDKAVLTALRYLDERTDTTGNEMESIERALRRVFRWGVQEGEAHP